MAEEAYAPKARQGLAEVDAQLKAIGYDSAAHDAVRKAEQGGRRAQEEFRALENARAALAPLEREMGELEVQLVELRKTQAEQEQAHLNAAAELAAAEAGAPDLHAAERELLQVQEQENRLRMDVGAARQKVTVLGDLRGRKTALEGERQELARPEWALPPVGARLRQGWRAGAADRAGSAADRSARPMRSWNA